METSCRLLELLFVAVVSVSLYEAASNVRLRGGGTPWNGRVEILINKTWGTVCDNLWDINDANVICRQLGYNSSVGYTVNSIYGGGETGGGIEVGEAEEEGGVGGVEGERVWVDEVECQGEEDDISECNRTDWGVVSNECYDHSHDAGVICSDYSTYALSVRLVGGATDREGRVEIFFGDKWGGVCDDGWGVEETAIVCKELGFSSTSHQPSVGEFGEGPRVIWLDDVECSGGESKLADCQSAGWGEHNCDPTENIAVRCVLTQPCTVRISSSNVLHRPWAGIVEVFTSGEWGRVCAEGWGLEDAQVVCKQLGYHGALEAKGVNSLSDLYWLTDVECAGYEERLCDCSSRNGLANSVCNSSTDASIVCTNVTGDPYDLRLVGGVWDWEGRIEVSINGEWGTVCGLGLDSADYKVICRQLGHQPPLVEYHGARFDLGEGMQWFQDFNCTGNEESVFDCRYVGRIGEVNSLCNHYLDASVICQAESTDPEAAAPLRLFGGPTPYEGQLQVLYNGRWGKVCDDGWDMTEASISCSQLGYGEVLDYESIDLHFEPDLPGPVPFWLDDINCHGNEETLSSCPHSMWGMHDCSDHQAISLHCSEPDEEPHRLRLVGDQDVERGGGGGGRLEILYGGVWGTICTSGWDFDDSDVACRQLGFHGALALLSNQMTPEGSGIVWLENVGCRGNESRLTDCDISGWGLSQCNHSMDVSIICIETEVSSSSTFDLMPSSSPLMLLPLPSSSPSSYSPHQNPISPTNKSPETTPTPSNSPVNDNMIMITMTTNLQATPTEGDPVPSESFQSQPIVIAFIVICVIFIIVLVIILLVCCCALCKRLRKRRVYDTSNLDGKRGGRSCCSRVVDGSPSHSFSSAPPHTLNRGDEEDEEGDRMREERMRRFTPDLGLHYTNDFTSYDDSELPSYPGHVINTTNSEDEDEDQTLSSTKNETFV